MSDGNSSEEVTHPWVVTSDGIGPNQYTLRRWNAKLEAYTSYVTGFKHQMQTLCDAMNRLQELDAVEPKPAAPEPPKYGERGYIDPRHTGTEIANEEPAMPWCYCDHCKRMPFYTTASRVMHLTVSNPTMNQIRVAYLEWELGWVPFDTTLGIISTAIEKYRKETGSE